VIPAIVYNFEVAKKEKDSQIVWLSLLEKKKKFSKKKLVEPRQNIKSQ
jgi:hypothetical protein